MVCTGTQTRASSYAWFAGYLSTSSWIDSDQIAFVSSWPIDSSLFPSRVESPWCESRPAAGIFSAGLASMHDPTLYSVGVQWSCCVPVSSGTRICRTMSNCSSPVLSHQPQFLGCVSRGNGKYVCFFLEPRHEWASFANEMPLLSRIESTNWSWLLVCRRQMPVGTTWHVSR